MSNHLATSLFASAVSGIFMSAAAVTAQAEPVKPPVFVDMHAVFVLDVSGSMDAVERDIVAEGLYKGITSPEVLENFDDGLHYAFTLVLYGSIPARKVTTIVTNVEQAKAFIDEFIYDLDTGLARPLPSLGGGTDTTSALIEVGNIFSMEEALGFISGQKAVIVTGDDDSFNPLVGIETLSLGTKYGATVYGLPIMTNVPEGSILGDHFRSHLTTPAGMTALEMEFPIEVRPGVTHPVNAVANFPRVLVPALDMSRF
jgi:hypothetical protein